MKYSDTRSIVLLLSLFLLVHCGDSNLTEAEKNAYLEKGATITAGSFTALSSRVAGALAEGGVAHAVQYCNLAALPLTDSLSAVYQATIRRTSLNVRNTANAPSAWEREVLEAYAAKDAAGEPLEPVVQRISGRMVAYAAPIRTLPLCLKCHGVEGTTLSTEDAAMIRGLYPGDQATGYAEGDLRGIWSVTFNQPE